MTLGSAASSAGGGVLVFGREDVRSLLSMADCMHAMATAFVSLASGRVEMPLRQVLWLPEGRGAFASMPVVLHDEGVAAVKVLTVLPGNRAVGLESHQGAVLLFELERGRPLAIADATEVTAIRTAAVSGVATRMLARQDAAELALLGAGTQARTHLEAMRLVRPVTRVRVWSRTPESAEAFAREASGRDGLDVSAVGTAREAVEGADLVCTVTSSREPVLAGEWLSPGAHVNAVGAVGPAARELDTEAVRRSRLYVDLRRSAEEEAGELVMARDEGAIGPDHVVGELGELLVGKVTGRGSPEEVTVFRAVGLAVEDAAAVLALYRRGAETGAGTKVEL